MSYQLNIGETLVKHWFKVSVKHHLVSVCFYMRESTEAVQHTSYVMWCPWQGRWEKFKTILTAFFFSNWKRTNDKTLISMKMLLFFDTITTLCANVPVKRVSFCLWERRLSASLGFTLFFFYLNDVPYTWLLTNIYNSWIKTKGKYIDITWLLQKL